MKKKVVSFLLLSIWFMSYDIYAQNTPPYIITFFFRPDTYQKSPMAHEDIKEHLATPGKFAYKLNKRQLVDRYKISGIFVAYAGFFMSSDSVGQVTFPRKNQKPQVRILVTQAIKPIFVPTIKIPTKTVSHWQVAQTAQAAYYLAELKKDESKNVYYWYITEQKLPKYRKIPNDALIIFTDPKYINVPLGPIQIAPNSPHFILPDFYVSPKLNQALSALRFLKVKKYFAPLRYEYKFEPQGYIRQITR